MSDDTRIREFLQRMSDEIDGRPLDWRAPAKRARRYRSITIAAVAISLVMVVAGGAAELRSLWDDDPRPVDVPTPIPTASLAVFGWTDGVRSLDPGGEGDFIFECAAPCGGQVVADWSPDGTRLAFSTGCAIGCDAAGAPYNGLHVVDPDGTDRQLVRGNGVGDVAWAPDGTRIAYVQYDYDQESWTLNVINHDGSGRTRVPTTSDVARLSWSPDGSQLVYQAGYDELYLTRLDGSAPTALGTGRNPAWSPDGTSITYFDACDVRQTTLDGQNVRLVDLKSVSARCDYGGDLEWSPDGTELAAMVFQDEAARKGWTAVYLVSPDGSARSFTGWVDGWPWDGLTWRPTTTARRTA